MKLDAHTVAWISLALRAMTWVIPIFYYRYFKSKLVFIGFLLGSSVNLCLGVTNYALMPYEKSIEVTSLQSFGLAFLPMIESVGWLLGLLFLAVNLKYERKQAEFLTKELIQLQKEVG